ncbi:MAG: zinc ribbon domain-containing protein [Christensenellales bacterium]
MNQLELLWEYQQADVEVDNLEQSIKRSPKRQKLVKLRESYQELQTSLKDIEDEIVAMVDRIDALKDAINATEDQVKQLQGRIQDEPASGSEGIRAYMDEALRLSGKLTDFDQETRRIRKNAADRDRKQRDVKTRLVSAKEEFIPLRDEYDAEYKDSMADVERLRAIAKEKQKGIEPEYLEKYKTIKRHSIPPMAKLQNGQCGGCNMSFPSSVLHSIKSGKAVECENCGRMIIG